MYKLLLCLTTALLATSVFGEHFHYGFTLPTNLVTLGYANVTGNSLQLTSPEYSQASLAYYPNRVLVNVSFATELTWVPSECDPQFGCGDGYAFFLTKDAPTAEELTIAQGGNLGIRFVPNTFIVGYSAYYGQLYVCEWTTPPEERFFESPQCNVTNVGVPLASYSMKLKIEFDGSTLTVYNDSLLLVSVPQSFELEYYYTGLSGGTGQAKFRQLITEWTFASFDPNEFLELPFTPDNLDFFGTAEIINGSLQLTTGGSESGAIVYSDPFRLEHGFSSQFTWTPSNCDSIYNGADGFTFFVIPAKPTNAAVVQSSGGGLGVMNVNNVLMTAYSATYDQFYICNWTVPFPDEFRFFCPTAANTNPKMTCGANYTIGVSYSSGVLSLWVNGFVQISTSTASIDSGLYYVGLSAATGQGYFQQNFDNWSFKATPVQYTVLHHPQPSDVGIGSTSQIYPVYQITNGSEQAGAVYTTVGDVSYRFVSEFAWIGQNCSKNGRPSVGFSHYFTPSPPTNVQVQSSAPYTLGIGNTPDVYMAGYDAKTGTLFICYWNTIPLNFMDPLVCSNTPRNYRCDTPTNFKLTYQSSTLRLFVNGALQLSRSVSIAPQAYYGGFSATTKGSSPYMTQRVSNWTLAVTSLI